MPVTNELFNELNPAAMSVLHESKVFQRRLHGIAKKLEAEIEPFKPVSKDHFRTNKNGINLEKANPFKKDRNSVDAFAQQKNIMRKSERIHHSQKKIPDDSIQLDGLMNAIHHSRSSVSKTLNMPSPIEQRSNRLNESQDYIQVPKLINRSPMTQLAEFSNNGTPDP